MVKPHSNKSIQYIKLIGNNPLYETNRKSISLVHGMVNFYFGVVYWAIQRSWFARVNALCNLSRKKSREVAAHFRADF